MARSSSTPGAPRGRPGWLGTASLTVAVGLVIAVGAPARRPPGPDTWAALVQVGDELAAGVLGATLGGQPLTARKAYLLAFHEAQDAGDVEHVLAVADHLDAAGDGELADHVRRAASALLEEIRVAAPQPGGPPASG